MSSVNTLKTIVNLKTSNEIISFSLFSLTFYISRRSCNEIVVHGWHAAKKTYKSGFYMIHDASGLRRPVYCDMETTPGEGYTLLVTAANSGWKAEQVGTSICSDTCLKWTCSKVDICLKRTKR